MNRSTRQFLCCVVLLFSCLVACAGDRSLQALVQQGTRLHDAGDYKEAIALYRRLLDRHPGNTQLLYELANSSIAAGNYDEAIAIAQRALAEGTDRANLFHIVLGNALDLSGKWKKGEKAFRRGLKEFPDDPMLHFNLGVNLAHQGEVKAADVEFQEALRYNPAHASSWQALAILLDAQGHRVRAFVSYIRFLTLEPNSPRSCQAASRLWALLFQGVEVDSGKNSITVEPPSTPTDPWWQCSMMMSITASCRNKAARMNDAEFFATAIEGVALFLDMFVAQGNVEPFWKSHIVPYFTHAHQAGHLKSMAYDIRRSLNDKEVLQWIKEHPAAIKSYRYWSSQWEPVLSP